MMYTPTPLCLLAEKYAVDKCPKINHSYTPKYYELLDPVRDSVKTFLEIGIGNVPLMSPIAGRTYLPGASLRMWRDFFERAGVYGCDILRDVLFSDTRIKTFHTDQSNEESLIDLASQVISDAGSDYIDVILDDGSHIEQHMELSFKTLWQSVRPNGGLYIIEDIRKESIDKFSKLAQSLGFADAECAFVHVGRSTSTNQEYGFVAFKKS